MREEKTGASTWVGSLQILATALLWSTSGMCVKLLPWGPLSIGCARGLLSAAFLLALRLIPRRKGGRAAPLRLTWHTLAAAATMAATSMLYVSAVKLTTAANAIVLQYIAPILVLFYTVAVEKRRPTVSEVLLTLVVFGGCALAFADQLQAGGTLGNVLALCSGLTFAAQVLLVRSPKTNAMDAMLIGCVFSFLVQLPFLLADASFVLTPTALGIIIFLGICQYGLANVCFAAGMQRTEPLAASLILTMEPIFVPVWVFLFLGEAPGALAVAGFVCVIGGVTLYSLLPLVRRRDRLRWRAPGGGAGVS